MPVEIWTLIFMAILAAIFTFTGFYLYKMAEKKERETSVRLDALERAFLHITEQEKTRQSQALSEERKRMAFNNSDSSKESYW